MHGGERRSSPEALAFDAMVRLADDAAGRPASDGRRAPATVVVRVDKSAFERGETVEGEVCEIPGVGPIPVRVARQLATDGIMRALIIDGTDVHAVSHAGRTIPARLRTALEELQPECVIAGCHVDRHLEIDHNEPFAMGGPTELTNLHRLCHHHHDVKTRGDFRIVGDGLQKRLVLQPAAPRRARWRHDRGHDLGSVAAERGRGRFRGRRRRICRLAGWTSPRSRPSTGSRTKWSARWEADGTYRVRPHASRASEVFSIDTPPPTVSGSLHMGSVFGYAHTDAIARYQRMRGREVFYPMGWDDNGLPTERRVQNYYGVRCDPSLPYDPDFAPPGEAGRRTRSRSRGATSSSCATRLIAEDEKAFEELWRRLGLSVDWDDDLHDDRRALAAGVAAARSCATSRAARRTRPRRRRCGTSTSGPRSRRPSSRTASCRARTTRSAFHGTDGAGALDRDDPPRAAPRVRRAGRASRRRALPAAVRHDGDARRCSA